MRRPVVPVLLAVLAVAAPVAAAPVEPRLRTERVWFHCADAVKVQNVALAQGRWPGWDTRPPAGSVQSGAGCGYYENAGGAYLGPNRTTLDAEWEGTFVGNLDALAVELHAVHVSAARVTGPFLARVTLFVDGKEYFNGPESGDLRLTPEPSATRASDALRFTLTRVGLVEEEGEGTRVRRYRLVMRSLSEEQTGWVFDASEVPAGLTFNPAQPQGVVVRVR